MMIRFAIVPLLLALNFSLCKKHETVSQNPQLASASSPAPGATAAGGSPGVADAKAKACLNTDQQDEKTSNEEGPDVAGEKVMAEDNKMKWMSTDYEIQTGDAWKKTSTKAVWTTENSITASASNFGTLGCS